MVYQFYTLPNLELKQTYYQYSEPTAGECTVYKMEFSPCGTYLAIIDSNHATIVFKQRMQGKWEILGKVNMHKERVLCMFHLFCSYYLTYRSQVYLQVGRS